ncbi:MAG: hypothetical protein NC321_10645 [Clostridium sp.]|nr:hypothetical protein [Clostridium sp.]
MDILIDRIKNFLIISTATVLLYCYALYTRTYAGITTYAPIVLEPPTASIQVDLDVINTYFQEQVIVVKSRIYPKYSGDILYWETDYDKAGNEIRKVRYKSGGMDMWTESEYREDGQISAWIRYDGDGSDTYYGEYQYDDAGNRIELTEYNSSGEVIEQRIYAYDEAGNEIAFTQYLNGSLLRAYECIYDGNKEIYIEYNGGGDVCAYDEYEYNEAGDITKAKHRREPALDIEDYSAYWYRYNEAGDIEKIICYDESGNVSFWKEYQYDKAGNQLSEISYNDDYGVYTRCEHKYDKNGKKIKETVLEDGEIVQQYEYCYDEWGNITEDDFYTYEYEYETVYTSRQPVIVYKKEYHDGTLTCQSEYDRTGKEIGKVTYDCDGNILKQISYNYDKIGNLIEQTEVYPSGGTTVMKEIYIYNEADDMTKRVVSVDGKLRARYEYEYDKTGRQKSYTVYNKDGDICSYSNHEYKYDETGNVISDTTQVYDTIMTDIETERFDTTQEKYEYEYDETGRKEKEICYMDDMMYYGYEWEYDEKGRILVETEYSVYDGSITAQDKYEYDGDGKKVKKIRTKYGNYGSSEEEIEKEDITEYSYDMRGNLIEERTGEKNITYEYIYE